MRRVRWQLVRKVVSLSLVGLLFAVCAFSQRQVFIDRTNSTTLPKRLRLGTSAEGYSGELDVYQYQDERRLMYWIEITTKGSLTTIEESGLLFMNRLEIELDDRTLDLEGVEDPHRARNTRRVVLSQPVAIEPETHSLGPARGPDPPEPQVQAVEQKSFTITRDDLLGITESDSMTLRVSGSTGRDSQWTLKPKKLEKLSDWIRENV